MKKSLSGKSILVSAVRFCNFIGYQQHNVNTYNNTIIGIELIVICVNIFALEIPIISKHHSYGSTPNKILHVFECVCARTASRFYADDTCLRIHIFVVCVFVFVILCTYFRCLQWLYQFQSNIYLQYEQKYKINKQASIS